MDDPTPVLTMKDVTKHYVVAESRFGFRKLTVRAVDGLNLTIAAGSTLSIVGESGCGKSTTARLVLGLEDPTTGKIYVDGKDRGDLDRQGKRSLSKRVQAVFQDPFASLDPRMRVGDIVGEPLRIQENMRGRELDAEVSRLLDRVGINPDKAVQYPHEFSGGQRQRIALARAVSTNPGLIVLDEPVSSLDVSVRAQVLNLLMDLQAETGISFLLISHDLALVRHMAGTVAVMYAGRIVEHGPTKQIFDRPLHPYTRALLAASPSPDPDVEIPAQSYGEVPNPAHLPAGCRFHPRCPLVDLDMCTASYPDLRELEELHLVSCFKAERSVAGGDVPPAASDEDEVSV